MSRTGAWTPATDASPPPTGRPARAPMRLCLGGAEFWSHLERDIRRAREYVYAQTLSFEGDAAGLGLAEALLACEAPRKRIVADAVTKYLINDRFIGLPRARRDPVLQREVAATGEMCDRLERGGVPVRFTWPVGRRFHRLIVRNHKKLVAIDDRIAYLGGINFSEHNFAWHDFMIRIESPGIAAFLRQDFEHTWRGHDRAASAEIDGDEIVVGEGRGNPGLRDAVSRALDRATDRIVIQCPYISEPFWSALGRAHRRGVHVTVMMPEDHNRAVMKWGTLDASRREGFEVLMLPGPMSHAKVMRIDDSVVLGSANFDYVSFRMQPEVVLITSAPDLVREIGERILEPDLARCREPAEERRQRWRERLGGLSMRVLELLSSSVRERRPSPIPLATWRDGRTIPSPK